jgi:hypothetical protein
MPSCSTCISSRVPSPPSTRFATRGSWTTDTIPERARCPATDSPVARAAEAYRPVRDEIAARVREAEQRARERWDRIQAVAARPWWSYRVDERFGVVWVSHEEGSALDTPALAEKLMEVRRETGITKLHWKPGVRPEVERSSGADFETWWRAVVPRFWTGSHTIPETRVDRHGRTVHISAHTSFTGIDSSFGGIHT